MFVLGFLFWMYNRSHGWHHWFFKREIWKKDEYLIVILKRCRLVIIMGYTETFTTTYKVEKAKMEVGEYRSIMGNQAVTLGLIAAAQKSGLQLFLGSYPITPASDILHDLAKYKNFGVKTFQAEDEIAAITSAIGAAYGGSLGVTTSSGPGIALKAEAMGLAVMLEIPLIVINIQRGGPFNRVADKNRTIRSVAGILWKKR
jgi:Pyruvate:ferredoxin oxidoreductase and related 2-oxoacid:ferredoxin oxidoreductases, alpha subunit